MGGFRIWRQGPLSTPPIKMTEYQRFQISRISRLIGIETEGGTGHAAC